MLTNALKTRYSSVLKQISFTEEARHKMDFGSLELLSSRVQLVGRISRDLATSSRSHDPWL